VERRILEEIDYLDRSKGIYGRVKDLELTCNDCGGEIELFRRATGQCQECENYEIIMMEMEAIDREREAIHESWMERRDDENGYRYS